MCDGPNFDLTLDLDLAQLIPNVVSYENLTALNGDHIQFSRERRIFLEERGHQLKECGALAVTQLVVQTPKTPINMMNRKIGRNMNSQTKHGTLIAVSDPRKGGCPAAA